MQIQLNNQFEHNGIPNFQIDAIIRYCPPSEDSDMADCTSKKLPNLSKNLSDNSISTNNISNIEGQSSASGSGGR